MQRLLWPFDDPTAFDGPADEQLGKFRQVRDQIESRVKAWLVEQR
jgi:arsenate reductase